jgi:hypothetical protein
MQLSFLGQSYTTSTPAIEASPTQETAKFLGKSYAKKSFNVAQRQQPSEELTFMGRRYTR